MALKTKDKTLKSTSAAHDLVFLKIKGLRALSYLFESGSCFFKSYFLKNTPYTFKIGHSGPIKQIYKKSCGCSDFQDTVVCYYLYITIIKGKTLRHWYGVTLPRKCVG